MSVIGKTIVVKGEVHTSADITLEGCIEGTVLCGDRSVILAASADVRGTIIAGDITVFGCFSGQLVATDVVDVRPDATVKGKVVSKRFILDEAALFNGHVEPQHLEAALRVAEFERRRREALVASGAGSIPARP